MTKKELQCKRCHTPIDKSSTPRYTVATTKEIVQKGNRYIETTKRVYLCDVCTIDLNMFINKI